MLADYLASLRRFGRDVRLLLAVYGIMGFGYVGLYTLLFNLYLLRLGFDIEFVGLANAAGRMGFALAGLPAGLFGARFGVRRLMIAGECVAAAGMIGVPFGELLPGAVHGPWIGVCVCLSWIGAALFFVNVQPHIMAVTTDRERRHAYSAFAAVVPLSAFCGSMVGGVLPGLFAGGLGLSQDHPAPYGYPLMLAGSLFLCTIPLVLATRTGQAGDAGRDGGHEAAAAGGTDDHPTGLIALLAAVVMLAGAGAGASMSFYNVYLDDHLQAPTTWIGTITALGQLIAVPAAALMPVVAGRLGNYRTYITALCAVGLALVLMALVPVLWVAALAFVGVNAASSLAHPLFTMYSQSAVSAHWRPLMSGAAFTSMGIGWGLVALVGGTLIERFGYATLFLTMAAVTCTGALLFAVCFRAGRGRYARREALAVPSQSTLAIEEPA